MPPGQEGKITLLVERTESYVGETVKNAQVRTNDPLHPEMILTIRAYFKAERPPSKVENTAQPASQPLAEVKPAGPFTVSPNSLWVAATVSGSSATTHMYLRALDNTTVRIKQVIPGGTDFIVNMIPIEAGRRYELRIATNPELKPGDYRQTIKILTDSKEMPEMEIPLEVKVLSSVFVSPTYIIIPGMPIKGEEGLENLPKIYVRKIRGNGLVIKKISSTLPFINLKVSTEKEGQIYLITLSVDKSKAKSLGAFLGEIQIETTEPANPIAIVPIRGSFY